ncbi:M61 family metallopeptidase [Mucilaginibacter pallidiroseus]|uniref:M61 family metallopeptidase n=1 Tax=Mucilaginibacter pallidiroseus TaxID=2599295 RepID=A0A563UEG5_9SPHI|nr:PDZ domain-containing protein [Mucilaginibacter pallidiroseus]TWR29762.1 M61 family metallopeptidase [Mucilaginibacter pallidiroseus]
MKKLLFMAAASMLASAAIAQTGSNAIVYNVSFPNAAHHEAEISMTIPQVPAGPLKVRMSRSSPGRYATHEFGKNVYNVKATDATGKALTLKQLDGDVYELTAHPSTIKISYTLFGNWTDGTYTSIEPSHAHFSMPASFMWGIGLENRPAKFVFNDLAKHGWRVATQLKPEGANVYSARDMQYMMDSPIELSAYKETSWVVKNTDGKDETIKLSTHSDDDQATVDKFADMVKKVVLEEKAIFGELPTFDYGSYVFLHDVHPSTAGDGMEHRNSTVIVQPVNKVGGNEQWLLGTFSHEFFHSWNVERIRPKTLEPFNFTHANMSNELWCAEGFTQYYGELALTRAGFHTPDEYTRTLAGLINSVLNTPGAKYFTPIQASRYAIYADAGVAVDQLNTGNIFTSYYYYGGATALALDLRLRSEFNKTLDDFMRQAWLTHGKTEKPYTVEDLQAVLAKVTNPGFAADFFKRYIYGVEKNDYAALLDKAGYVLRKAQPGKAWIGSLSGGGGRGKSGQTKGAADGVAITSPTIKGTPVYKAGLDAGDVITKVDGNAVDAAGLSKAVSEKKPGDKLTITYTNRTGEHETVITADESPAFEVVSYEKAGKQLTKQQQDFRDSWLSSKVK